MSYQHPPTYTVRQLTDDLTLLDITGYVTRDSNYPHPLGSGAAGVVHRGLYQWTDPDTLQVCRMKVVVKEILGEPAKTEQRIRREVATWRYLKHPNVTEFLGLAVIDPNRPPGLVSRFMYRNHFLDYIGRHPEQKKKMALEIALGLEYLHSRVPKIVHGDIKPDNILITDHGVAQLNDFGVSQILDVSGFTTKVMRNMRYTAPELLPLEEMTEEPRPTMQSDIYSLAMLLLVLFNYTTGLELQMTIPYNHVRLVNDNGGHEMRLLTRMHAGERPHRERYRVHDYTWQICEWCWQGGPMGRPAISEVANSLRVCPEGV